MAFPNYVDSTFAGNDPVVFSGGSWNVANPLTNLINPRLVKVARSTNTALASTKFDCDLGVTRDVNTIIVPTSNVQRSGRMRARATANIAWDGVTVNGVNGSGSTTLSVATTSAITVNDGDGFSIAGDSTIYQATAAVSIGASSTGTISLKRVGVSGTGLVNATVGGEVVTCHSGDFETSGSVVIDSGWRDVWLEQLSIEYTDFLSPSFWDGKLSNEDAVGQEFPFIVIETTSQVVRYVRLEIDDTGNTDGYIELPRFFVTPGWQPTINLAYGNNFGYQDLTQVSETRFGSKFFQEFSKRRSIAFSIDFLTVDEAMTQAFEMQRLQGISKQIYFIFDPDNTIHLQKWSFLATMRELKPLDYINFNTINADFVLEEVIG